MKYFLLFSLLLILSCGTVRTDSNNDNLKNKPQNNEIGHENKKEIKQDKVETPDIIKKEIKQDEMPKNDIQQPLIKQEHNYMIYLISLLVLAVLSAIIIKKYGKNIVQYLHNKYSNQISTLEGDFNKLFNSTTAEISGGIITIDNNINTLKKEYDMDIDKMSGFINQVKSLEPNRWSSRKLWLTITCIGAFVYLFKESLPLIIWPVTILAGLYLIISYLENRDSVKAKVEIKKALIDSMVKDGEITPTEADIINKVS